jgi:hypothetical protein
MTACQRDQYWPSLSNTSRTERSRTSGGNLFVVLLMMLHPTQELEPPADPARFTPMITLQSSTRGIPCESGKNGDVRAICASESRNISDMRRRSDADSESVSANACK